MNPAVPRDMYVLERGWLSSNNIVFDDDDGVSIVDTGYVSHAAQTLQLLDQVRLDRVQLDRVSSRGHIGRPLRLIVNTHLHSDHVGGNAALQRAFPHTQTAIPPGGAAAVAAWDETALSYRATGQQCPRFMFNRVLQSGESITLGRQPWRVLAAPGHDPHMIMLFNAEHGVLISADALWQHGFGAIFPEIEGEPGFAEQAATLDLIEQTAPQVVIPGHGAPFTDVAAALARAGARLDALASDPLRNARHVAKALVKFWLLDVRSVSFDALTAHFTQARYLQLVNERYFALPFAVFMRRIVDELIATGAATERAGLLHDAGR